MYVNIDASSTYAVYCRGIQVFFIAYKINKILHYYIIIFYIKFTITGPVKKCHNPIDLFIRLISRDKRINIQLVCIAHRTNHIINSNKSQRVIYASAQTKFNVIPRDVKCNLGHFCYYTAFFIILKCIKWQN